MNEANDLLILSFRNRLKSLQNLCLNYNNDDIDIKPISLLFICGCDSKNNIESYNIIKYLFFNSTNKFLLDGMLDDKYDILEEVILLVQHDHISIFYNKEAKLILNPLLSQVPDIYEYISLINIEIEIDKYQTNKCIEFKRMILEHIPFGSTIGVPITNAVDILQDIETWPMLQSFALDSIVIPTGFFTSKYDVIDITNSLVILYKTVDSAVVSNAVNSIQSSVLPHVNQLIDLLDTKSVDQRIRLSAEVICGPLDMLYEFGELDCIEPSNESVLSDPLLKPIVLIGSDTSFLGNDKVSDINWRSKIIDKYNLHLVFEGLEPSTGIRFCRTYFLHRGIVAQHLPAAIQSDENDDNIETKNPIITLSVGHKQLPTEIVNVINRLTNLYYKLCYGFRIIVKYAFASIIDVLDAGNYIQTTLESYMRGKKLDIEGLTGLIESHLTLKDKETLQLHFDCMNSFGQVISVDEVDELGGSCWTYIRASIHGISILPKGYVAVAVGDTFLFTPSRNTTRIEKSIDSSNSLIIRSDHSCITHAIPYYKWFVGYGPEEKSYQHLIQSVKNPYILPLLNIGSTINNLIYVDSISLITLLDHPLIPHAVSTIHPFSEGLVIESIDITNSPILINFNLHLSSLWIIDTNDLNKKLGDSIFNDENIRDGLLVILEIKSNSTNDISNDDNDIEAAISQYLSKSNPLAHLTPLYNYSSKYIGFYSNNNTYNSTDKKFNKLSNNSRQLLSKLCNIWRPVLESLDIPIHRGSDSNIPQTIIDSFFDCNDSLTLFSNSNTDTASYIGLSRVIDNSSLTGCGYLPIKIFHSFNETIRLSINKITDMKAVSSYNYDHMIITGYATSGIVNISNILISKLSKLLVDYNFTLTSVHVNLSTVKSDVQRYISEYLTNKLSGISENIIVVIILIPSIYINISISHLHSYISRLLGGIALSTISIVNYHPVYKMYDRFGNEAWESKSVFNLIKPGVSDTIVLIDNHIDYNVNITSYISDYNPIANVIKISTNNLLFNEDDCNDLVRNITSPSFKSALYKYKRIHGLVDNVVDSNKSNSSIYSDILPNISNCTIRPDLDSDISWNIKALIKLLQYIYPHAIVNNSNISDQIIHSNSKQSNAWLRMIQLATVKTLTNHHIQMIVTNVVNKLHLHALSTNISILRGCIFGIVGYIDIYPIYLYNDRSNRQSIQSVFIEANTESIIISPISSRSDISSNYNSNCIKIIGNFNSNNDELNNIKEMFKLCNNDLLYPRTYVNKDDISKNEIKEIQSSHLISSPSNNNSSNGNSFVYDGNSYVDIYGNRKDIRPDISNLIDSYVVTKNKSIDKYNNLLKLIN